jgi:hypothetical protein
VLTEEVVVWDEPDLVDMRPKQQSLTLPLLPSVTEDDSQPRRLDAVVYWYHVHLPTEDGAEEEEVGPYYLNRLTYSRYVYILYMSHFIPFSACQAGVIACPL